MTFKRRLQSDFRSRIKIRYVNNKQLSPLNIRYGRSITVCCMFFRVSEIVKLLMNKAHFPNYLILKYEILVNIKRLFPSSVLNEAKEFDYLF